MTLSLPSRLATGGLLASALLLGASPASAATAPAAQTTDQAGDGRVYLSGVPVSKNLATADLLAAGVRVDATTVTVFSRLGAAPAQSDVDGSKARYGVSLTVSSAQGGTPVTVAEDVYGYETQVTFQGPGTSGLDAGYSLQGTPVTDAATGEVTVTFDRAAFAYGVALAAGNGSPVSFTTGAQLQVAGATSSVSTGDLLGNRTDSAAAGPTSVFTG